MKKRFIVSVDSATAEQDNAFKEYIKASRLGWWHWLSNLWLLIDSTGVLTSSQLTDVVFGIYPGVSNLVLEVRQDGSIKWAGYGPSSKEKNMFAWIRTNFKAS